MPGRRREHRPRLRRDCGRRARAAPGVPIDHVHRLARDRRRGDEGSSRQPEARAPRARRQERDHRARRRGSSISRSRAIVWSAFGTSGQRCTAASRVIAHEKIYDALQSKLVAAAERLRLGPGWDDAHRRRPGDQPGRDREDPLVHEDRQRRGRARCSTGGEVATEGDLGEGLLLPADDLRRRRRADAHRAGGDLRPDDRADQGARLRRGGPRLERHQVRALVVDLHARREQGVPRDARPRQPGITYINAGTTGAEVHLPFGGTKDTGNGHREAGQAALDVFTEWKSIYVDYCGQAAARADRQHE